VFHSLTHYARISGFIIIVMLLYLFFAWLFLFPLSINLFVTNVFSFSMTFTLVLLLCRYSRVLGATAQRWRGLRVTVAVLTSLSVSEYFVFFLSEYGRVDPLLAIGLSSIIAAMYFGAFNIFFDFRHPPQSKTIDLNPREHDNEY